MGGVTSILDSCGCGEEDPITFMEREYNNKKRIGLAGPRTTRRPDILTSALYGAMNDLHINRAKNLDQSDYEKQDSENEYLEHLKEGNYQRRGSGDSVASFMTDIRTMDYKVSFQCFLKVLGYDG